MSAGKRAALFLNRPLGDLLVRARSTLVMSQRQFGEALGASHRTAERWDAGQAKPTVTEMQLLARLVYPKDRELAAEIAWLTSETLVGLGLEQEPVVQVEAPPPERSAPDRTLLVEAVFYAAADAGQITPAVARAAVTAALRRARELGVTVDEIEQSAR